MNKRDTDGPSFTRRAFLTGAFAGAVALANPIARAAPRTPRFTSYPFALGVASGYPTADGVVLWTRLAPDPLQGGTMGALPIEVAWEVAHEECFRRIARRGVTLARPEDAHSVHVEIKGLAPARWYWYRFRMGSELSPVGRTRTAPAVGAELADLRFAFASCQHYEHGYYTAYRHMARDALDLVVHLGDYIYEGSWGGHPVRAHTGVEPVNLGDYRNRYALYRSDLDLQAIHAAFPWVAIWDDHEVDNDYANDRSEDLAPRAQFLARRAAAYRAYYEHMPLPASARPRGPDMRLYARVGFGGLAAFHLLDDRQYRDYQACPKPGRGGANTVEACAERSDPNRSVLGSEQERWLTEGLTRSRARWNLIAQQTLMARIDRDVRARAVVLDRRLGRLPRGPLAPLALAHPAARLEPDRAKRRRPRLLCRRSQARLRRSPVPGRGHGVRDHLHQLRRQAARAHRCGPARKPAHQARRRHATRLHARHPVARSRGRRNAGRGHRKDAGGADLDPGDVRRRGWEGGGAAGMSSGPGPP